MSEETLRRMMPRVAIFVLLGPFLVWLSYALYSVASLFGTAGPSMGPFLLLVLFYVMALGIVPGIVLAVLDHLMAHRGLSRVMRAVVCSVLGYPMAIAAGWYIGLNKTGMRSIDDYFYLGCLFAVLPAALCSWLAGRGRATPVSPFVPAKAGTQGRNAKSLRDTGCPLSRA